MHLKRKTTFLNSSFLSRELSEMHDISGAYTRLFCVRWKVLANFIRSRAGLIDNLLWAEYNLLQAKDGT